MFREFAKTNLILAVLVVGSSALAQVPNRDLSSATIPPGSEGSVLLIHPDGFGNPFSAARLAAGPWVDATITLTLVHGDSPPLPLAGFPAEDLWLETSGGGLGFAPGGTIADGPTDVDGHTQWQEPMRAGGCTSGETVVVMVAQNPLTQPGLPLEFNSVDINGDLLTNLGDVTLLSIVYFGAYDMGVDFYYDGVLNLADIAFFSQWYNP